MNNIFSKIRNIGKEKDNLIRSFNKKYKIDRYYIKGMELDGTIIFYNSEHFDTEAFKVSQGCDGVWTLDSVTVTYIKFDTLKCIMKNVDDFFSNENK